MIKKFNEFVNESVNDKLKLKVLFLCGLPNSGKSTVIKNLSYIPFHNIDMDKFLKLFADKEGVDLDLRYDAPNLAKKTDLRIKSRDLATDKMLLAIDSLLAIVVDGTGRDPM
jgi:chloramphenicol 3-O-phosphotransferase